jgi:hypothetical protein
MSSFLDEFWIISITCMFEEIKNLVLHYKIQHSQSKISTLGYESWKI